MLDARVEFESPMVKGHKDETGVVGPNVGDMI